MVSWRLAFSLDELRGQLDARWPNRDRSSDGAIGDAAHAATASDHNPNAQGVVCAYDIDTDLDGTNDSNDPEMDAMVEGFRLAPHPDLKYLIYRGRMFSAYAAHGFPPFTWRPYLGPDMHTSHAHVSVGVGPDGQSAAGTYDDRTPWTIEQGDIVTPEDLANIVNAVNTAANNIVATVAARLDNMSAALQVIEQHSTAPQTVPGAPGSLSDGDVARVAAAVFTLLSAHSLKLT